MAGFAIRLNGTCLPENSEDCGAGAAPFNVCCPKGAFCLSQYNRNCCATAANCTNTLVQNPFCANSTWDLYDNNGYFCCERGKRGYAATLSDSSGCADPDYQLQRGEVYLYLIKPGSDDSTSTSSISTPIETLPTPSASTPSDTEGSSSTNAGAIAGGVVGGVAAIAVVAALFWFLRRRGRSTKDTNTPEMPGNNVNDKDDQVYAKLAPDSQHGTPAELASMQDTPVELADMHGRSELHDPHYAQHVHRAELQG